MNSLFISIVIVFSFASNCVGWNGKCVGVSDGDTLSIMQRGAAVKVRLYGIDCPERGQPFWKKAKEFTGELAFGREVQVETVAVDRYGRTVAWIWCEGKNVNRELLRAGLAWWYRKYSRKDVDLWFLERNAKSEKRGLWSEPNPTPPWQFRRKHITEKHPLIKLW